jgi:hypothetical protein
MKLFNLFSLLVLMASLTGSSLSLHAAQKPGSPLSPQVERPATLSAKQERKARRLERKAQRLEQRVDALGGASLAAGVITWVAFLGFSSVFSLVLGLAAVGLGILSLVRIRRRRELIGKGLGIAGIALGGALLLFIGLLLASIGLAF